MVGLKSVWFTIKCKISLAKLCLKCCFLLSEKNLLSKKHEAKSKHFSERLFDTSNKEIHKP